MGSFFLHSISRAEDHTLVVYFLRAPALSCIFHSSPALSISTVHMQPVATLCSLVPWLCTRPRGASSSPPLLLMFCPRGRDLLLLLCARCYALLTRALALHSTARCCLLAASPANVLSSRPLSNPPPICPLLRSAHSCPGSALDCAVPPPRRLSC